MRHGHQKFIAHLGAMGVLDGLKPVQAQVGHGQGMAAALALPQSLAHPIRQQKTSGKVGNGVAVRDAPDVGAAVTALKLRGVQFVESQRLHPEDRGALTRTSLGSVAFELVHRDT